MNSALATYSTGKQICNTLRHSLYIERWVALPIHPISQADLLLLVGASRVVFRRDQLKFLLLGSSTLSVVDKLYDDERTKTRHV
jgi:hypothetical protein